jgi:hypothetical protein
VKPTIAEIALDCFGAELGGRLLERGAVHPILDKRNRKAPFVRGVQHGYFDIHTREYEAVGFQAGELSGIQVLDIDDPELLPGDIEPNVLTRRGAHYYGPWDGGMGAKPAPSVDLLRRVNVVFFDDLHKTFKHPRLLTSAEFDALVRRFARH